MLSLDLVFEVVEISSSDPAPQAVVRALAAGVNEGASRSVMSSQLQDQSRSPLAHDSRLVSSCPVDTRTTEDYRAVVLIVKR